MIGKRRLAVVLTTASALTGCNVGPDFAPPNSGLPIVPFQHAVPGALASQAPTSEATAMGPDPNWWKLFHDPILTRLEQRVADANLDVLTATVRIAESRARRGVTAAAEFPQINGTAKYQRERYSQNGIASLLTNLLPSGGAAPAIPAINEYTTGFDASWELDLWGRVRRQIEAADAEIEASEDQRRETLVSTLAEVANDYVRLRGAQAQLDIAKQNVKTEQGLVDLTQTQQEKGLTTGLDVENAKAQLQSVRAQIPSFEQQESAEINALSLLLDLPPDGLRRELARPRAAPSVPRRFAIGVPFGLARRRPDIRQAEDNLHAQTADIGVAVASFFPSVSLSGVVELDALQFNKLFQASSLQYMAGPTLTLPIFEGGRLKSMLELSKSNQQEAAIAYRKAVLQAWHDVANALVAYRADQTRRGRYADEVSHAQTALGLARDRYNDGVADFTTVLNSAQTLLSAQQMLLQSTVSVSSDLVQLYKALGGGWEEKFPEAPPIATPPASAAVAQTTPPQ